MALQTLTDEIAYLSPLVERWKLLSQWDQKLAFLDEVLLTDPTPLDLHEGSLQETVVMKAMKVIGQYDEVFCTKDLSLQEQTLRKQRLVDDLIALELFYQEIGGIIGYHCAVLQFLQSPKQRFPIEKTRYLAPVGPDLSQEDSSVRVMIYQSIQQMHRLSEIYPIGGAADRLRLRQEKTGKHLPAARLFFNGKTLLERLIEDLQAREYVYFKLKGHQITVPIAMMTSEENNHQQIDSLCEESHWFHRPRDSFFLFSQPLVPAINREGRWTLLEPMKLFLKPGGHGVLWKLARDKGVIRWLTSLGVSKAIIRQINNPISAEDYGLLAFSGYGLQEDKLFGFASCPRRVKASEGINVIIEQKVEDKLSYSLTNIEYCDFQGYRIEDEPEYIGGSYSKFPSNTNLIFADLAAVEQAVDRCPIPGLLVNMKKIVVQHQKEEEIGRLESTMQNMADCFQTQSLDPLSTKDLSLLDTYITFNTRRKTISATKKEYVLGGSLLETPEGCFLDVLDNRKELLQTHCAFSLPKVEQEDFNHPSFLFHYHPALGPIYSLIGKKLRGGTLLPGAELGLLLAECDIQQLSVDGSFLVEAERVMGYIDEEGMLRYSNRVGRITLKNVQVKNRGIDASKEHTFWKQHIHRTESCRIFLEGESELYAEDVLLEGDMEIRVEDGYRVTLKQGEQGLRMEKEKLSSRWYWSYQFLEDHRIDLQKKEEWIK